MCAPLLSLRYLNAPHMLIGFPTSKCIFILGGTHCISGLPSNCQSYLPLLSIGQLQKLMPEVEGYWSCVLRPELPFKIVMMEWHTRIRQLYPAVLLFFCCHRQRQRSKAAQVDSEKADSEESGSEKDQSVTASPGFFGGARKQGAMQTGQLTPRKNQRAESLPRTPESQKVGKREGQGWNFVARALPWKSPTKPTPISPGGSDKSHVSNLSDHAAKAALKYKAVSPQHTEAESQQRFTGPGFNPVRITGEEESRHR